MDACNPFYTQVLGYTSVFDRDLPDGLIDEVVGLPPGSRSRLNLMYQLETKTPAVELIQSTAPAGTWPGDRPRELRAVLDVVRDGRRRRAARRRARVGLRGAAGPSTRRACSRTDHSRNGARPNGVLLEFFASRQEPPMPTSPTVRAVGSDP